MDYCTLLKSFSQRSVLVVGDVMLDHYLWGNTTRISPEAPVPVVNLESESYSLGGAANVAANIAALGGKCTLAGYVGRDKQADDLREILKRNSIDAILLSTSHPTITKTRIMSGAHHMLRVDHEEIFDEDINSFYQILDRHIPNFDIIVLSDYNKGTITRKLVDFLKIQNKKIIADPKPQNIALYHDAYLIKPNLSEAKTITKKELIDEVGAQLQAQTRANVIITQGKDGMTIFPLNEQSIYLPTNAKNVYDVTGAGDTTLALLALALSANSDLYTAAKLANMAAGIKVSKIGTEPVTSEELFLVLQNTSSKIKSLDELITYITLHRKNHSDHSKIVFTNGCYDILHVGHTRFLQQAKSSGDILILGLNSDASTKRLKGDSRPILRQNERAELLSNLSSIDAIIFFDEDTPLELIKKIKPDYLVKGKDYDRSNIVGADFVESYGGKIISIPEEKGHSTSSIIDKIKKS